MADYKELLRRAIESLSENNGAARRAVYEKARSALVGQLRAINPPLPARDITQHRLQLEDCIRDVEREASEANIAGLKASTEAPPPKPAAPPASAQPIIVNSAWANAPAVSPSPEIEPEREDDELPAQEPVFSPIPHPPGIGARPEQFRPVHVNSTPAFVPPAVEPEETEEPVQEAAKVVEFTPVKPISGSIEDIIAQAERTSEDSEPEAEPEGEAEPEIVIEPEAEPEKPALFKLEPRVMPTIVSPIRPPVPANSGFADIKPFEPVRRGPTLDVRRDAASTAKIAEPLLQPGVRHEPSIRSQTIALQQVAEPIAVLDQPAAATAMSAVREVEVEPTADVAAKEAQVTIERAIATLDREARGETTPLDFTNDAPAAVGSPPPLLGLKRDQRPNAEAILQAEQNFPRAAVDNERGGFNAITIFLVVFLLLLAGAGGAGFWAWREGYIDLQAMFGSSASTTAVSDTQASAPNNSATIAAPTPDLTNGTGPGNTATPEAQAPATELKSDERLSGTPVAPIATPVQTPSAAIEQAAPNTEVKTEERLAITATPVEPQIAPSGAPALDAATTAGNQSLLLEASDDGTTGAVPFSGTVEWTEGKDETGLPTLVGKATIPARNLGVDVLIRKNSDPSLPASHLMEINFSVTDSFIGGSIAGLPGVLLKNEELVQGTPLVGASARVVADSFLFALSASQEDSVTNSNLLTSRKWIDLAIVYATGKRAIITLEKDDAAQKLFAEVFKSWGTEKAADSAAK